MRILLDGQKLPANPRTTKDLLVMIKSLARILNWRTLYDPAKEVIYISTVSTKNPLTEPELQVPLVEELESIRLQDKIICIDPGHGGDDFGATGPSGTLEKDNTLAIALFLKEKLENNGATVIMTRYGENERTFIEDIDGIKQRVALINDSDADIFVSIHNDAFSGSSISGTATFHYGNDQAVILATCVQNALVEMLATKDRGARFASFYLLRYAEIPGIVIEPAFITNPEEELLLASSDGREKIAEGIYTGITRYFKV